jgi:hypothetical protein
MNMAKGQKRRSREPKKEKGEHNKAKKLSGPKYLRQPELPVLGRTVAQKIAQKP